MNKKSVVRDVRIGLLVTLVAVVGWASKAVGGDAAAVARAIREAAGFRGGVIVHVGCGDGRLTMALHAGDDCIVQGLDVSPEQVEA